MIREVKGDILRSTAVALVVPVNTVGVMGAGLAKPVRRAYPQMFTGYAQACHRGTVRIGQVWTYPTRHPQRRYLICLPTKRHWRDISQLEDVHKGVLALRDEIERLNLPTVAIPALGCGLGGLPWPHVKAMLLTELAELETVRIDLYPPREER